jgi:phosphoenolpyruvate carboxykinase (ATP)
MGEIIKKDGDGKRTLVRKAERVPISVMAAIQRGDFRGSNRYERGRFGTGELVQGEEGDMKRWQARNFYSEAEIETYLRDIVEGRRKHTALIAAQGLRPEIVHLSEDACDSLAPHAKRQVAIPREVTVPPQLPPQPQPDEARAPTLGGATEGRSAWISGWEPRRPPRPLGRWK